MTVRGAEQFRAWNTYLPMNKKSGEYRDQQKNRHRSLGLPSRCKSKIWSLDDGQFAEEMRTKSLPLSILEPLGTSLLVQLKGYIDSHRAVSVYELDFDVWLDVLAFKEMFEALADACERVRSQTSIETYLVRLFDLLDGNMILQMVGLPELVYILTNWEYVIEHIITDESEPAAPVAPTEQNSPRRLGFEVEEQKFCDSTVEELARVQHTQDEIDDDEYEWDTCGDNEGHAEFDVAEVRCPCEQPKVLTTIAENIHLFHCWNKDRFLAEFERQVNEVNDLSWESIPHKTIEDIYISIEASQVPVIAEDTKTLLRITVAGLIRMFSLTSEAQMTLDELSVLVNSISLYAKRWNA